MIDERQQIASVRRTLGDRTIEADAARVSTISQVYDTGIEDLWDVVTSAERISRWFMPVTGELKEGGHYQITGNANGTVTRCEPPRGYAATWEYGGQVSWIEVRLTPESATRTRFELEHVAQVDDELWDRFGPGATGIGWDMTLWALVHHLEKPDAVPDPAEVAAWIASDGGKLFMRLSSDRWAEVAVANGDDPEVARARADRSYDTYTGA